MVLPLTYKREEEEESVSIGWGPVGERVADVTEIEPPVFMRELRVTVTPAFTVSVPLERAKLVLVKVPPTVTDPPLIVKVGTEAVAPKVTVPEPTVKVATVKELEVVKVAVSNVMELTVTGLEIVIGKVEEEIVTTAVLLFGTPKSQFEELNQSPLTAPDHV